jgi:iduronate 2-sulfatase
MGSRRCAPLTLIGSQNRHCFSSARIASRRGRPDPFRDIPVKIHHRMWGKATNFELSTRVPFLVRVPHSQAAGKRTKSLVELVGLYPTLCDLAGLPKPKHLQGSSFASLFDDPNAALRKTAFSQYSREGVTGHSLRTQEWRDQKTDDLRHRELYDHRKKSREEHNRGEKKTYTEQVEQLSRLLNRGWREGNYE